MNEINPQQELSLRRELNSGVDPKRELEIRRSLSGVAPVDSEKGFIDRVKEDHAKRKKEVVQTYQDLAAGEIGVPSAILQTVGKGGAGMTLDIIGEGVVEAADAVAEYIPEDTKDYFKEGFSQSLNYIRGTEAGQAAEEAIMDGARTWAYFKKENPQEAKNVESVVNVGMLAAPAKVRAKSKPVVTAPIRSGRKYVGSKASKQVSKNRMEHSLDLVTPEKTKKILTQEARRTRETGRFIKKQKVIPTFQEKEMAKEVYRIKGVSPSNTIQKNLNLIDDEVTKLHNKLVSDVSKSKATITAQEANNALDVAIRDSIKDTPLIVGNLETTAIRVAEKAKRIFENHPQTPAGMLKARKEFDSWVKRQPGGEKKLASDAADSAQTVAIRTVRKTMNDLVDSKVHNTAVKKELHRQRRLLEAAENIAPKAANEATTMVRRVWQNSLQALGVRNKLIQELAAVSGIGGLGAAAVFAPSLLVAGVLSATAYGGYRAVTSSATKKVIGKAIKLTEKSIEQSTNGNMIRQMRADRAALVELYKNVSDNPEEKQ